MDVMRPRLLLRIDATSLVAALLPVAVVLVLLVPVVDVDPTPGLTFSNSPFTDEGWSLLNARNWAIFGMPATDEWELWLLTLPFTVLDALVFMVFGVGIVQARLVDVAGVAITAGLLSFGLRRPFGGPAALVAGIGYGTSTLVLFYGRLAFLEPLTGLFLAAGTIALLGIDGPRPGRSGLLGGLALALAVGTKATAGPSVIAVLLVAAIGAIRSPAARRWTVAASATLGAAAAAWGLLIWLPHRTAVMDVLERVYPHQPPTNLGGLLRRGVGWIHENDHALRWLTPLLVGASGGALASLPGLRAMTPGTRALVASSVVGFAVGLATIMVGVGSANRYVVGLIPWLAILSAPLAAVIIGRLARLRSSGGAARPGLGWAIAVALAIALAAPGVVSHASWMGAATRNLVATQAAAARDVPAGAVVAGGYGPILAMTSRSVTIVPCCGRNPVNQGDLYVAAGARIWADVGPPSWAAAHPAEWDARQFFACLPWTRVAARLCLQRLP